MSKIKDLLAETEGIDDLMPVHVWTDEDVERLTDIILDRALNWEGRDRWLQENAEYGVDENDCGLTAIVIDNFFEMCDQAITELFDGYIEEQALDVPSSIYDRIIKCAAERFAEEMEDTKCRCEKEAREDDKYILDEIRDRNGGSQY